MTRHISQFFSHTHLKEPLQGVSKLFTEAHDAVLQDVDSGQAKVRRLKENLELVLPNNPEKLWCMRKMHVACNPGIDMAAQYSVEHEVELVLRMLLEAKDCAVRAVVAG